MCILPFKKVFLKYQESFWFNLDHGLRKLIKICKLEGILVPNNKQPNKFVVKFVREVMMKSPQENKKYLLWQ